MSKAMMDKPLVDWKKIAWEDRLSGNAKAEILGSVIHLLRDHMPEQWKALPKWYQESIRHSMWHCAVGVDALSKRDLEDIREYFAEMDKNPKTREKKPKTKQKPYGRATPNS